MVRSAVFFDRDGVLNEATVKCGRPYPPASLSELRVTAGAIDACERLRSLGFVLAVVTNQPDIARGTGDPGLVAEMNDFLRDRLGLDSVWVCPHDDGDGCGCRKPAPGLIHRAAEHHNIDLAASFLIGDRWRDIGAGRAAGCRTILIRDPRYTESMPWQPDFITTDIQDAARWIETELESYHRHLQGEQFCR